MHDPMEVICLGRLGSGRGLLRAAAHAVVLAAYFEAAHLTRPVVSKTRAPDFIAGPETAADVGKDSRSPLHRSVSPAAQQSPDRFQKGPGDSKVPNAGPSRQLDEFETGENQSLESLRGHPSKVPELPNVISENIKRGPAPRETAEAQLRRVP